VGTCDVIRALVEYVDIPVIASGASAVLDDIRAVAQTGAAGVVIGSAIYTGKFTLTKRLKHSERTSRVYDEYAHG